MHKKVPDLIKPLVSTRKKAKSHDMENISFDKRYDKNYKNSSNKSLDIENQSIDDLIKSVNDDISSLKKLI